MIRGLLLAAAFTVAGHSLWRLLAETRHALHAAEPIVETLRRHAPVEPGVVLVYQPEDCAGSGEMFRRWIAGTPDGASLTAVVVGGGRTRERQRKRLAGWNLRVPLHSIPMRDASLVAAKLGYRSTPFAVIVDAEGRVAASAPAGRNVPREVVAALVRVR